jgi:hypothetical protein
VAILFTITLAALGGALVAVAVTETRIAANFRDGHEALYAADAGLWRAIDDLDRLARWGDVPGGDMTAGFAYPPPLGSAGVVGGARSLEALTLRIQAASDARVHRGPDTPVWRLFAWGPVTRLLPGADFWSSPLFVAVWLADDPAETDGNPREDANGLLWLHAAAYGPGGATRAVEAVVAHGLAPNLHVGRKAGEAILNPESDQPGAIGSPGVRLVVWHIVR